MENSDSKGLLPIPCINNHEETYLLLAESPRRCTCSYQQQINFLSHHQPVAELCRVLTTHRELSPHPTWRLLLNNALIDRFLFHILTASHLNTQQSDTKFSISLYHYLGDEHHTFIHKYSSFLLFTWKKTKISSCARLMTGTTVSSVRNFWWCACFSLSQNPQYNKSFLYITHPSWSCRSPYSSTKGGHMPHSWGTQHPSVYERWQVKYGPLT